MASFVKVSSDPRGGSAFMSVTERTYMNTFLLGQVGANYGNTFNAGQAIPFAMVANAGQYSSSLSFKVKGPGNYKWKGHLESTKTPPLDYLGSFAVDNDLPAIIGFDQWQDTQGDLSTYDIPFSAITSGLADVSAAGTYEVTVKLTGSTNPGSDLVIAFIDGTGLVTEFTFRGLNEGQAKIVFLKTN